MTRFLFLWWGELPQAKPVQSGGPGGCGLFGLMYLAIAVLAVRFVAKLVRR